MFKGACTALITPFTEDGKVDYKQFENLLNFQISNNIDALLVCGTTGEPATMSVEEKINVIKFAIKVIDHRVPVIVGTGSNSTSTAIQQSLEAQSLGADGILVVTPYYNKCSQEGLYRHYKAINDAVNIPIIAYNVPGRTGVNIQPATVKRFLDLKNIIGIKEASGNISQINELKSITRNTDFILFSGDDSLTLPMLSLGCQGVISVASNIIPNEMHNLVTEFNKGNIDKAREIHFKYLDLMNKLFLDVNPIPIKAAASNVLGCFNTLRLPLCELSEEKTQILFDSMKKCGVYKEKK